MRRILVAPAALLALALAYPAAASARHGRHHGLSHQSSHHRRHGRHAQGSTAANTNTAPTAPEGENAGTVESFTGGVLTIKLAGGGTVSGKVTEDTGLHCVSATSEAGTGDGNQGDGGDHGWSSGSDMARMSDFSSSDGDDDDQQETCTTALLVENAVVRKAKLELTGAGAVWECLLLVH